MKLIDGHADWMSFLSYHRTGRLGWREWWGQRKGPRKLMLFRFDDPGPFVAASISRIRERLGWWVEATLGSKTRRALSRLTKWTGERAR